MIEHYMCILPSGNKSEFDSIDQRLNQLNVNYEKKDLKNGGRMYRVEKNEYEKLPTDEKGYYLPITENSGHALFLDEDDFIWNDFFDLAEK